MTWRDVGQAVVIGVGMGIGTMLFGKSLDMIVDRAYFAFAGACLALWRTR